MQVFDINEKYDISLTDYKVSFTEDTDEHTIIKPSIDKINCHNNKVVIGIKAECIKKYQMISDKNDDSPVGYIGFYDAEFIMTTSIVITLDKLLTAAKEKQIISEIDFFEPNQYSIELLDYEFEYDNETVYKGRRDLTESEIRHLITKELLMYTNGLRGWIPKSMFIINEK